MKHLCLALFLGLALGAAAEARTCTPKDAEAADAAIDHLATWADVYGNFKNYGHCDDGSIAEGNSEGVARLLVDKWQTLPQLAALIKRHPAFRAYVLRQIDTTLNTDDLDRIAESATAACPKGSDKLCASLKEAATKAVGQ
jgi:hypothetical protein